MENFRPKVDFKSFENQQVDQFALQQILKLAGVSYQYLFGSIWEDKIILQKPDGKRTVFPDIFAFKKARETYFAWLNLKQLFCRERPVFPEKTIQRLMAAAYTNVPLTIFIPWGYRPRGQFGLKEINVMNFIDLTLAAIGQRQIPANILVMPADIYAIEINGEDENKVKEYFTCVEQEALLRGYQVIPWSKIRADNCQEYLSLYQQYNQKRVLNLLPPTIIDGTIKAAEKRKKGKKEAFAYLRERLCEATIIEETFKPVKLSMVAKNKDNGVDLDLPRLYVLPESLQFPWL